MENYSFQKCWYSLCFFDQFEIKFRTNILSFYQRVSCFVLEEKGNLNCIMFWIMQKCNLRVLLSIDVFIKLDKDNSMQFGY